MANVKVRIPTPLRSFLDGRAEVEVEAGTAREALERLTEGNEPLRAQLYNEEGRLRQFVNVYVGDRNLRDLDGGDAPLEGETEVRIVPSIAGGRTARPGRAEEGTPAGSADADEAAAVTADSAPRASAPDAGSAPGNGAGSAGTSARIGARAADVELSSEELRRYSRHLMIPEVGVEGQKRLKAASALLVGAGGLGSPLGLYLAAAGVGRIGIVDHDVVDFTNLQRQVLHDTEDVGRPKLASARERLEALNPEVEIVTREVRLDSSNALEVFEGWDLIVDGSDNFPTRYLVNDAAVMLGIPTVWGAIFRFEGQVSVFGAEDGPCYRCLFREPPPPGLVPSCADAGVLGVLPGIVGTIQAAEAIKQILGAGEPLVGRLLLIDALRMEFREVSIRRDPACPVCGDEPTVTELIDYELFCGVGAHQEEEDTVPEIEVTELKRRIDAGEPFQLVDVREGYEWEICNLGFAGARLIPLSEVPERLDEMSSDGELVVHCRSGGRSARAVEYLRSVGFENAVNLKGGVLAWAEEIDPEMPTY